MIDSASHDLMTQALGAFESAGAPASFKELAFASLTDPEAAERFTGAVESFCRSIDSPEAAAQARVALHLASRSALAQKTALAGESRQSRQASSALMSYLSNSAPEA